MARYCVAFDSMKIFLGLKGTEGLAELVGVCLAMAYGDGVSGLTGGCSLQMSRV